MTIARQLADNTHSIIWKYKLPLDPWRLTDPRALVDFARTARQTADVTGVVFSESQSQPGHHRNVIFFDTNEFHLYRNNFVLRKRILLGQDHSSLQELVFKFRHPDRITAARVDPRPLVEVPHTVRFKEQILPALDDDRGSESIFWHGCKIIGPGELENLIYEKPVSVFPVLRNFEIEPDARVKAVRDLVVHESFTEIGRLRFGQDVVAKALISLWRVGPGQRALTGEFSFQIKLNRARAGIRPIRRLAESFYLELRTRLVKWTAPGGTKVRELYRLTQAAEPVRDAG